MSHTILLVQANTANSRTYCDYESVNDCIEGVCKMYEEHLKHQYPNQLKITYDVTQLFNFIDSMGDLACLVYHSTTKTYTPYNKNWIKEKIYILLRGQVVQQQGQ